MAANETANGTNEAKLSELARAARAQAQRVTDKLPLLGPVTWLMMQDKVSRLSFVADLEWRIMPPLVLDQAKLYLRDGMPLAFVTWGLLSSTAVERYRQAPHHLAPADWKSGDQTWIIDIVAPFGGAADVIKDLKSSVLSRRALRRLGGGNDSVAEIVDLTL